MKKAYIAVAASLDDEHLWDDHFGEAPRYHIFNTAGELIERRTNPYWKAEEEFHTGPQRITELLPECGVFLARHFGAGLNSLHQKFGVTPVITLEVDILSAIDRYLAERETS